jgi:citrate synthase
VRRSTRPPRRDHKRRAIVPLAARPGTVALALEEAALANPYFVDRHLYPNVDFYSGLIYRALGFREDELTCLFAAARASGWAAHALEQSHDPDSKIYRPRQLFDGPQQRTLPAQR